MSSSCDWKKMKSVLENNVLTLLYICFVQIKNKSFSDVSFVRFVYYLSFEKFVLVHFQIKNLTQLFLQHRVQEQMSWHV